MKQYKQTDRLGRGESIPPTLQPENRTVLVSQVTIIVTARLSGMFLTMTLLQGTAYMLIGTSAGFILGYVENIPGGTLLYAVMTSIMIAMFCGYMFSKRLKSFRLEVVPLVVLIYLQAYFWIVIVGVGRSS